MRKDRDDKWGSGVRERGGTDAWGQAVSEREVRPA
jgi:hypothetical protein